MYTKNLIKIYDYHVHIGQFEQVYYNPYKVIDILSKCGITGAYVSSTTSCLNWDNLNDKKTIVTHIQQEFEEAIAYSKIIEFDIRPLCWVIPQRYYEGDSVEQMCSESGYVGFKIHPRAHLWDMKEEINCFLMEKVCQYAEAHNWPIWIHTGICEYELPNKFVYWFEKYHNVRFVLAHCKDVNALMSVLNKYQNVLVDIAFANTEAFEELSKNGKSHRVLFGTDFPITAYSSEMTLYTKQSLYDNYKSILGVWAQYMEILKNNDVKSERIT